jgi:hypothetical protein
VESRRGDEEPPKISEFYGWRQDRTWPAALAAEPRDPGESLGTLPDLAGFHLLTKVCQLGCR